MIQTQIKANFKYLGYIDCYLDIYFKNGASVKEFEKLNPQFQLISSKEVEVER